MTTTQPGEVRTPAVAGQSAAPGPAGRGRSWWRRPWMVPLAVVAAGFIYLYVPRYLTFKRSESLIPDPPGFPLHYPLLVGHVIFGTVALVTLCLQVWPWLRTKHPKIHRYSGRIYVFGGAIPSGLLAVTVGASSPDGIGVRLSTVTSGTLWLICTTIGYVMIRQRRYADHRRWMLRSFGLAMSIVASRALGKLYQHTILPPPHTVDPAQLQAWGQTLAGLASWPGWILPLLAVEWWVVEREASARNRARLARRKAASVESVLPETSAS